MGSLTIEFWNGTSITHVLLKPIKHFVIFFAFFEEGCKNLGENIHPFYLVLVSAQDKGINIGIILVSILMERFLLLPFRLNKGIQGWGFTTWQPILSAQNFTRDSWSQTLQKACKIALILVFNMRLEEMFSCGKKCLPVRKMSSSDKKFLAMTRNFFLLEFQGPTGP